MRYLVEPSDRRYVKGYGFLSFTRKIGKNIGKNISNKYNQTLFDSVKRSATDAIKTASKRAIQKTAEATGDIIGNKIADKITSVSKKSTKGCMMTSCLQKKLIMKYQKKDTYLQKKDNKLLMN